MSIEDKVLRYKLSPVLIRLLGATHAEGTSAWLHPQTVGEPDERESLFPIPYPLD
jgi:hypothetical protein